MSKKMEELIEITKKIKRIGKGDQGNSNQYSNNTSNKTRKLKGKQDTYGKKIPPKQRDLATKILEGRTYH